MKSVLIIGAGPSAYISAKTCLDKGLEVTVVNPDMRSWQNKNDSKLKEKIILKHRFDQKPLYLHPLKIGKINSRTVDIFETFIVGGLSEIWGGVFFPPTSTEIGLEHLELIKFNEALNFIEEHIDFDKNNEIYKKLRSTEDLPRKLEGQPVIAHSQSYPDLNWTAANLFHGKEFSSMKFIDGLVLSIKQDVENTVEVKIVNRSDEIQVVTFNKVILAAGVFGSARILLSSLPSLNSMEIFDSTVSYGLGLNLTRKPSKKFKDLMSPEFIMIEFTKSNQPKFFIQVYTISKEMIKSLKYQIFHNLLIKVISMFGLNLRLVMVFQPSKKSKSILMKSENGRLHAKSIRAKQWDKFLFYKKMQIFFNLKLIPIVPFMSAKAGAGVHSGAYIPPNYSLHDGVIPTDWAKWPDVHVVGSASLPSVPTGPIMFAAMANSRVVTLNAIAKLT